MLILGPHIRVMISRSMETDRERERERD